MFEETTEEALLPHLAACVTFHFAAERLPYLSKTVSNYIGLARKTDVFVVTNISDTDRIWDVLPHSRNDLSLHFVTPSGLGHPFLLAWTHREVFREVHACGAASHFLYSEDDLLFGRPNVEYWLRYREPLKRHGLIPSFFRVEQSRDLGWVSTDCITPCSPYSQPHVMLDDGTLFVCMRNPYQGMYFLDRELMDEFSASPAMSPDFGRWDIRERAAQGLTFVNVPNGYSSRNAVPMNSGNWCVPREAWIHHMPNNYAEDPKVPFGKISVEKPGLFETRLQYYSRKPFRKAARIVRKMRK